MNTHPITREVAFRAANEAYTNARRLGCLPSEALKISREVQKQIREFGEQVDGGAND